MCSFVSVDGCTGAGKSYTMMGERDREDKQRGICARGLQHVFRETASKQNERAISVQVRLFSRASIFRCVRQELSLFCLAKTFICFQRPMLCCVHRLKARLFKIEMVPSVCVVKAFRVATRDRSVSCNTCAQKKTTKARTCWRTLPGSRCLELERLLFDACDQRIHCLRCHTENVVASLSARLRPSLRQQMSFVEIYNEQLFDLLQPEAYPAQRRFNVYGRNDSAGGKRNTSSVVLPPVQTLGEHSGSCQSSLTRASSPQQAELTIYERPDGSTYVKVKQKRMLESWPVSGCHFLTRSQHPHQRS